MKTSGPNPIVALWLLLSCLLNLMCLPGKGQDGTVVVWGYDRLGETDAPPALNGVLAIAAFGEQSLALKSDGTVAQWGQMGSAPADVSNVVAIASGSFHNVALKSDSSVISWGNNNYGQATVPADLTNAVAVAAGYSHSLALREDGTVIAWGWNYYGQANVPAGLNGVAAIGCGANTSFAIKANGTVVSWGDYSYGQLAGPAGLSNVVAIAGGWGHTLALRADGLPFVWGQNPDNSPYTIPSGLRNIVGIAACGYACEAVTGDGLVIPMGYNYFNMTFPDPGITNGVGVACGLWHYMAFTKTNPPPSLSAAGLVTNVPMFQIPVPLTQRLQPARRVQVPSGASLALHGSGSGAVLGYQWQLNGTDLPGATTPTLLLNNVQLNQAGNYALVVSTPFGPATATVQLGVLPLQITGQPKAQTAFLWGTAAFNVSAAVQGPFSFQWQFNGSDIPGATTNPLVLVSLQPAQAGLYSVIVSNSLGSASSSNALLSVLNVAAWGANSYGQTNIPVSLTNVLAIAGGYHHSVALRADGTVAAWGAHNAGQTSVPPGLSNAVSISSRSGDFSMALRLDGTVAVWGDNSYGQTSIPAGLSNVVAIAAGGGHCLALKADGMVASWGYLTNVPAGLSNVVAIAAGDYGSLFLRADGTIASSGSSAAPAGLSNVVAVAMGYQHGLALKADGTVVTWGSNSYGQTNVPAGLTNAVAIAAGDWHSYALRADGTVVTWGKYYTSSGYVPAAPIPGLSNVIAIASGSDHDLALLGQGPPILQASMANPRWSGSVFSLSLPTQSGRTYRLEFRDSLTANNWSALPLVSGIGASQSLTDTNAVTAQRLYRVRRW